MKKIILSGSTLLLAGFLALGISSCKKADDTTTTAPTTTTTTTDDTGTQKTAAADESSVSSESDKSLEDVNAAVGASTTISGKIDANPICGATVVSDTAKVVITYDGITKCGADSSIRSGTITVQRKNFQKWRTAGSMFTITYSNYTSTKNGKTIKLSGYKVITNVSGGLVSDFASSTSTITSITHKIKGAMSITFDDGTNRNWYVSRSKTYTKLSASDYTISIAAGDSANVLYSGTNRLGRTFVVTIPSNNPIVVKKSCGWHRPISGQKIHTGLERELAVTFGVDITGVPVTAGSCASYYKLNWINTKGEAKQAVINY
jgi:hypothetical protein